MILFSDFLVCSHFCDKKMNDSTYNYKPKGATEEIFEALSINFLSGKLLRLFFGGVVRSKAEIVVAIFVPSVQCRLVVFAHTLTSLSLRLIVFLIFA